MSTIYRYNLDEAIAAAFFVSKNNPNNFSFQHVWDTMMKLLKDIDKDTTYVGTMGFFILVNDRNVTPKGMEYEVSFLVEPCYSSNEKSYQEGILEVF
jgi:hypothetical protein